MMFVALCDVIAFAVTPYTTTAAESFAYSPPATFTACTLRAAGVRDPTTMAARAPACCAPSSAIRTVSDVAGLDSVEVAELFDGLRVEGPTRGSLASAKAVASLTFDWFDWTDRAIPLSSTTTTFGVW
jgi:hypothetical protein